MSFIVSGLFLKPLVELIKATKQVSQGDYSVQVDMGWAESTPSGSFPTSSRCSTK